MVTVANFLLAVVVLAAAVSVVCVVLLVRECGLRNPAIGMLKESTSGPGGTPATGGYRDF